MKEMKLRPYQEEGVRFLTTHPHALLADEPGVGKTAQAIIAAFSVGAKSILVVCPASVRLGWWDEVSKWGGSINRWDVISYNGAVSGKGLQRRYDVVILDEEHYCKTPESQRTQAIFGNINGIARRGKYIWCLTGTPVLNRPRELYPILKTLCPAFSQMSFAAYAQRYCGAYFDGRAINTKGASHLDELREKLRGFMLRRTKAEVAPELPPKVYHRARLDVTAEEMAAVWEEERAIGNREERISSIAEDFSQLGDLARLLRMTGEAKVPATVAYLKDLLSSGVDKVVVFARHREVIRRLEEGMKLEGVVVYHGGMSDDQKKEAVDAFRREGGARVFVGQIAAAGTGINGLQDTCSTVVFAELSWVPGEMGQAVDRCHRLGQTAECVNVHMLHVHGTLESAVLAVLERKEKVITKLMGN